MWVLQEFCIEICLRLSENCRNRCEADFQPLKQWAFGKLWINLYPTFTLPFSCFCLMANVLMIQSGITHETKARISQKTNEWHLLSSTAIIHPALPEHQLLHNGLKPLPSSAAEQIYISWLTLLCNLLCGGLWISGAGATERWQALSMFPFDYFPYSKKVSKKRFGYF